MVIRKRRLCCQNFHRKLINSCFYACAVIKRTNVVQNAKKNLPKFALNLVELESPNLTGSLKTMATAIMDRKYFRVFTTCAKNYAEEHRHTYYKPLQMVVSARTATTVDGIDVGDCVSRPKPNIGTQWCENMCALTDIADKCMIPVAGCATCLCR